MEPSNRKIALTKGAEKLLSLIQERHSKGRLPTTNQVVRVYWNSVKRTDYHLVTDISRKAIPYKHGSTRPKSSEKNLEYNLRLNNLKNIKAGEPAVQWRPELRVKWDISDPEVQYKAKQWYYKTLGQFVDQGLINISTSRTILRKEVA